jgi:type I restriction enzyme M protein
MRIFMEVEQSEVSRIFDNSEFGYWAITVERPLRLRVDITKHVPISVLKDSDRALYDAAVSALPKNTPTDDWTAFAKATKLKAALLKKVRPFITEKDPNAQPIEGEADVDLRDTEIVPFIYDGGIAAFMEMRCSLTPLTPMWTKSRRRLVMRSASPSISISRWKCGVWRTSLPT